MLNQAREALPETERRESPAASEAAAMVLMEVIGLKGMGGWGGTPRQLEDDCAVGDSLVIRWWKAGDVLVNFW